MVLLRKDLVAELQGGVYLEPLLLQLGCLDLIPNQLPLQLVQLACLEQPPIQDLELKQNLHLALEQQVPPVACLVKLNPSPLKPHPFLDSPQHKQRRQLVLACLEHHLLATQLGDLVVLVVPLLVPQ